MYPTKYKTLLGTYASYSHDPQQIKHFRIDHTTALVYKALGQYSNRLGDRDITHWEEAAALWKFAPRSSVVRLPKLSCRG